MRDHGYDVADYCDVDPRYGTLADVDALLDGAHARGMRVVADPDDQPTPIPTAMITKPAVTWVATF